FRFTNTLPPRSSRRLWGWDMPRNLRCSTWCESFSTAKAPCRKMKPMHWRLQSRMHTGFRTTASGT
ncbi:uncharacterized protein METZ01_LOCUS517086, partial [marine metagenome]